MKATIYTLIFTVLIGLSSCKKYLDINENPSNPQLVKAELLLAPIIYQMANGYANDQRQMNKFNQTILGASTVEASLIWERHGFPQQSDVGGVMWRMVYFDHGLNLQLMINDAITNKKYEYAAIGYAVKAWGYQMLTDYHGPIILDEALRTQQLSFKYNDQPDVYAKVRVWCDSALYYLDQKSPVDYSANLNSKKGDNLFRGNMDRWRKFVYGIRALQYIHLVNKPDFKEKYADSIAYFVDRSFDSPSDDAGVKFDGDKSETANVVSSKFGLYTTSYYNRAGKPIVRYLTGGLRGEPIENPKISTDPRLSRMLMINNPVDSIYIGGEPNVSNTTVPNILGDISSGQGKFIFRDAADFPLMTYAQLQLVKAEAMFIKGDQAKAYDAYIKGIYAHMNFVNKYINTTNEKPITSAEVASYIEGGEIPLTASELTLADIMGQKYIVQWGWGGLEQWCDLRKYHYNTEIFKQFIPLSGSQLTYNDYCYRVRPRYNSEYAWNASELERWGALDPEYIIKPTWFVNSAY
ncbi:SusD/RagB family nutrient-binding outer membrane lipoprotein [Sphingobacterium sp. DR205]|uniref:SusD/RagB family nutrient-binding outer membrane lipoprotein n=1 Tax=Sphingobacterium sp. DR205 TaxID=2713573 RepID=UPI0013E45B00|nr:SusD/RagB family nutrient-binding outer membrane lipoprotein [Sphingobacterium sp. DR205]QIH31610.1 SusD/RagB family nutrient-binding outer membrane lipoprotein [Sphingobacterium sp. DR205]